MQPTHLTRIPQLAATALSSTICHRLLKVGDVLKQSRRFTDADVVRYSAVSGDQNPIHLDADFSRQIAGSDRGRIVHGLLVASLIPSLIAFQFPGTVYASQSLQFKLPVYIGDEVVAEVKATHIRAIKEKYYVKWATKCYTSKECLVLDGEATTILPEITLSQRQASTCQAMSVPSDAATIRPMGREGSLRPDQCGPACEYRCSETSHKKPCLFFCNKCCAKCLCVPSGTYGHKEECPCYNNWKTKEGKPKCP